MNITRFRCSKCGKELISNDRHSKHNNCSECRYLEALGLVTIEDFNKWLKGEWLVK